MITLSAVHDTAGFPLIASIGAIIAIFLTWVIMVIMALVSDKGKKGGQSIVTRLMGLILITMGLQFVLSGIKSFFN